MLQNGNHRAVVLQLRGSDWQTHISVMHNVTMKAVLTVRAVKTIEADAPKVVDFLHNDLSRFLLNTGTHLLRTRIN